MISDYRKKCAACGADMALYETKCKKCGAEIQLKRNGFITFWLWLGIVVSCILAFSYLSLLFSSKGMWTSTPEPILLKIVLFVLPCTQVLAYYMLLKWNKKGFTIFAVLCVINIILNFIISGFSLSIVTPLISLGVLYAILHIQKDGISYWDAMDMKEISNK